MSTTTMSGSVDFGSVLSQFVSGDLSEPQNSIWLVYTAIVIETISNASHISKLWSYIHCEVADHEKQLVIARRLREGMLKTSPLAGFPRGINCLAALRMSLSQNSPSIARIYEKDKSMRANHSATELEARGRQFFDRVYAGVARRVQDSMALSSGGDLDQFAMLSIYGELMAEERILNAKETALMEFLICYISSAAPQAKGHMYGARNLKNGKEEVLKAIRFAQVMAQALNVAIDTDNMRFVTKVHDW